MGRDASEAPEFGATGSINIHEDLLCARPSSKQWGHRGEEERQAPALLELRVQWTVLGTASTRTLGTIHPTHPES